VDRIYSSTPGVRPWLTDVLASSVLSEVRQMIVFHYKKTGSNGKSTFFELVRHAFGELHEACQSVLLSESKRTSGNLFSLTFSL
jgi:phage/plasmid-associated DNA primase